MENEQLHTIPALKKEWYNGYLIVLTMDHGATFHAAIYSNGEKPSSHLFTYSRSGTFEQEIMKLVKGKIDKKMKIE